MWLVIHGDKQTFSLENGTAEIYSVKPISNKYVLRFFTKGVYGFKRFNRNRELIPNCWRSHRESTFANIQLSLYVEVTHNNLKVSTSRRVKYVTETPTTLPN